MNKIFAGDNEVLFTGTVISLPNTPVIFHIQNLQFHFIFKETEDKAQKVEAEQENNNILKLLMYNFNNPLGTGNTEPLCVGTLSERELLLQYRIFALGDGTNSSLGRTIHYTWYLGVKK